jgi:hypothetical protein
MKYWPSARGAAPLRLRVPADWNVTRFSGAPAPTLFPLVYFSRSPLAAQCRARQTAAAQRMETRCFDGSWPVPSDGFVIRWAKTANPTAGPFAHVPGRRTELAGGHRARLFVGAATARCAAVGAATEVDATILIASPGYETYRVRACLGPQVSASDRAAVTTMLKTAKIH